MKVSKTVSLLLRIVGLTLLLTAIYFTFNPDSSRLWLILGFTGFVFLIFENLFTKTKKKGL